MNVSLNMFKLPWTKQSKVIEIIFWTTNWLALSHVRTRKRILVITHKGSKDHCALIPLFPFLKFRDDRFLVNLNLIYSYDHSILFEIMTPLAVYIFYNLFEIFLYIRDYFITYSKLRNVAIFSLNIMHYGHHQNIIMIPYSTVRNFRYREGIKIH